MMVMMMMKEMVVMVKYLGIEGWLVVSGEDNNEGWMEGFEDDFVYGYL